MSAYTLRPPISASEIKSCPDHLRYEKEKIACLYGAALFDELFVLRSKLVVSLAVAE